MLCYRNNYAAARLQGLEEDLKLTGDQYQVGLSIFFVAYVSSMTFGLEMELIAA